LATGMGCCKLRRVEPRMRLSTYGPPVCGSDE
jgi:hypothetical protein